MLLSGIRVLEWTLGGITTAFCTRLLADLGAEVFKLEEAGGDPLRRYGALVSFPDGRREGALFAYLNAGKRSIVLDGGARDFAALRALAPGFQILVLAATQDASMQACLTAVREANPGLVILRVSPFGSEDPQADSDSFASDMVMQHRGGFAYEHARPVGDPERQPPIAGADREFPLAAGIAAAAACVAGLLAARRRPEAPLLDLSKLDFAAHLSIDALCATQRGERDFARARRNAEGVEIAGGLVWILSCRDGWVMISPREQHQWDRWVAIIGSPPWTADAALCGSKEARRKNAGEIQRLFSEWSKTLAKDDIFHRAQEGRVPCFPVSTSADLLRNEQLHDRGFFDRLPTADGGTLIPGLPFKVTTTRGESLQRRRMLAVPMLGDGNAILDRDLDRTRADLLSDAAAPARYAKQALASRH